MLNSHSTTMRFMSQRFLTEIHLQIFSFVLWKHESVIKHIFYCMWQESVAAAVAKVRTDWCCFLPPAGAFGFLLHLSEWEIMTKTNELEFILAHKSSIMIIESYTHRFSDWKLIAAWSPAFSARLLHKLKKIVLHF